jgi:hypothetical protein
MTWVMDFLGGRLSVCVAGAMLALALGGCATGTRVASFGPLPDGAKLVTLIVSDDIEVVRRECAELAIFGRVLGCHIAAPAAGHAAGTVRSIKIVRFADMLPSAATFEIDAHELCHAVAALQRVNDPCHDGNGGVLQAHGSMRIATPRNR